ncbi:MAG: ABC transporter ATP-binding protein [Candidatus Omnitrophica bacterium]|nr:ABC transporter ATP-binding protein [Candidatus Omnitrophota bacterium]MDE2215173.1 ABC transporter ATP-binding protein [Candidatus Omnitrophota bacterium]
MSSFDPLLSVDRLTVTAGDNTLVNQVSFDVPRGAIVAVAGGSGSGKTTVGLSILRLLPPALLVRQGGIVFEGKNLLDFSGEDMRRIRGGRIGMVFQEPQSALDPLFTIGRQMDEVLSAHTTLSKAQRYQKALETLDEVQLPQGQRVYKSFPHQLSGGMRQRAMVALAVACGPSLVIADEPTSSLDVTLAARIMELFVRLKAKGISILLIAHDLGMISRIADDVVILKQGEVVEKGPAAKVLAGPAHEYTRALIEAAL